MKIRLESGCRACMILGIMLFLFVFLPVISPRAAVIYVDTDATGSDSGTSWADAYIFLQDALAYASSGDQIWVAVGTYYPDEGASQTNGDRASTFNIPSNSKVYGGFDGTDGAGGGTLETLLSQRDWENNVVVLSGDLNQDDDTGGGNSENAYHVVCCESVGD